jgi:hypothetical protein
MLIPKTSGDKGVIKEVITKAALPTKAMPKRVFETREIRFKTSSSPYDFEEEVRRGWFSEVIDKVI